MVDSISKLKQSWPSYYTDCLLVECRIEGGNVCVLLIANNNMEKCYLTCLLIDWNWNESIFPTIIISHPIYKFSLWKQASKDRNYCLFFHLPCKINQTRGDKFYLVIIVGVRFEWWLLLPFEPFCDQCIVNFVFLSVCQVNMLPKWFTLLHNAWFYLV